jgi:hypothetical protein
MRAGEGANPVAFRWERFRRADTIKIRCELRERFAPATANKMLAALRPAYCAQRAACN